MVRSLGRGFFGHFLVEKRVGKVTYLLILSSWVYRVHSTFDVSALPPWVAGGTYQVPQDPISHASSNSNQKFEVKDQ